MRTPRERRSPGRAGKAGEAQQSERATPPGVPASGSLADLPIPDKGVIVPGDRQGGRGGDLVLQASVVALMRAGADLAMMREQITKAHPHITQTQVDNTYSVILKEWRALTRAESAGARTLVVARLRQDLAKMRVGESEQIVEYVMAGKGARARLQKRIRTVQRINWNAVRGHERLLAQIEGTLQPIKIQIQASEQVRDGFMERVSQMGPEEQEARIMAQLQKRKDAAAIVVPGVSSG